MAFFGKKKGDEITEKTPAKEQAEVNQSSGSSVPDGEKDAQIEATIAPLTEDGRDELPAIAHESVQEEMDNLEETGDPLRSENVQVSLSADDSSEIIPEQIFQEEKMVDGNSIINSNPPSVPKAAPIDLPDSSSRDENQANIFALLFKYGALSAAQIVAYFEGIDTSILSQWGMPELEINGANVYFHSEDSLENYAVMIGMSREKLQKKALGVDAIEAEEVPTILQEIEICLAFEKASGQSGYQFYDWLSANNPRKKRMLKIKRSDGKRGSLQPNLLVVLKKKSQKFCLIMEDLPVYEAFSGGEKSEYYCEILQAYHHWLSSPEKVKTWLQKRKVFVAPENTGVAALYCDSDSETGNDLFDICRELSITTPIFFASKAAFLAKPFSCWASNCETAGKNIPLKLRKKKTQS